MDRDVLRALIRAVQVDRPLTGQEIEYLRDYLLRGLLIVLPGKEPRPGHSMVQYPEPSAYLALLLLNEVQLLRSRVAQLEAEVLPPG